MKSFQNIYKYDNRVEMDEYIRKINNNFCSKTINNAMKPNKSAFAVRDAEYGKRAF